MHIPYNFGHTVEMTALLRSMPRMRDGVNGGKPEANKMVAKNVTWDVVRSMKSKKPDAEVWGHLNPDLNVINEVSGCPMYYTPAKYWPKDLALKYFGNKTIFGMLRDPYERLTAFFRGGFTGYGGSYPEFFKTCDVNAAVKQMMKDVLETKDRFHAGCTFIPQAEYFEGEYGVKLPIDNRRFPFSMNEAFKQHGYQWRITSDHIVHVRGCDNAWAGNLDAEARSLVQRVYARDFELLCKHFGYCDKEETVCLPGVPYMCPLNLFEWDNKAQAYRRKAV